MSTVRRPAREGGLVSFIAGAGDRLSCLLSGKCPFKFTNTSGRVVKLRVATRGGGELQEYFITIPDNTECMEVPLAHSLAVVDGGFFRPEDGMYEIFWERRPFEWCSGLEICILARHSRPGNRHLPEVVAGMDPTQGCLGLQQLAQLSGAKVFARHEDSLTGIKAWAGCDLKAAVNMDNGPLRDQDDVPLAAPSLVKLPPNASAEQLMLHFPRMSAEAAAAEAARANDAGSLMRPAPSNREHPGEQRARDGLSLGPPQAAGMSLNPIKDLWPSPPQPPSLRSDSPGSLGFQPRSGSLVTERGLASLKL